MKTLRDYQEVDLAFYMANRRLINAGDPGVGKTPPTCVFSYFLWQSEQLRSIWVQPGSILGKNQEEFLEFTPFGRQDVVIVQGPPAKRKAAWASGAKVFLCTAQTLAKHLDDLPPDVGLLVTDEHHMMFKSDGSQRTQGLYEAARKIPRVIMMSGTMVDGRLDTLYPAIRIIEPRYYGTHAQFMAQHAILDDYDKVMGWTGTEKLSQILSRHAIRRTFQDVYGPEAKVIIPEPVEMSPVQRALYDKFKDEAALELENQFLDGTLPGVAVIRARQIMSHPENILGEDITKGEMTGKDQQLLIHLEDHERTKKPLLIYAPFTITQNRILNLVRKQGIEAELINGTIPFNERARITTAFANGEITTLVASQQTMAFGFNLQFCGKQEVDHIIMESLDYQDSNFVQSYRRAIRGQRSNPLRITILEYFDSIDQRIYQIVEEKSALAAAVDPTREILRL